MTSKFLSVKASSRLRGFSALEAVIMLFVLTTFTITVLGITRHNYGWPLGRVEDNHAQPVKKATPPADSSKAKPTTAEKAETPAPGKPSA